jgi:aryl-alcohol dehydrogenase-like predicted oxidoreductase
MSPIADTSSAAYVEENVGAASLELTDAQFRSISAK